MTLVRKHLLQCLVKKECDVRRLKARFYGGKTSGRGSRPRAQLILVWPLFGGNARSFPSTRRRGRKARGHGQSKHRFECYLQSPSSPPSQADIRPTRTNLTMFKATILAALLASAAAFAPTNFAGT
jgi:hypothetical protein